MNTGNFRCLGRTDGNVHLKSVSMWTKYLSMLRPENWRFPISGRSDFDTQFYATSAATKIQSNDAPGSPWRSSRVCTAARRPVNFSASTTQDGHEKKQNSCLKTTFASEPAKKQRPACPGNKDTTANPYTRKRGAITMENAYMRKILGRKNDMLVISVLWKKQRRCVWSRIRRMKTKYVRTLICTYLCPCSPLSRSLLARAAEAVAATPRQTPRVCRPPQTIVTARMLLTGRGTLRNFIFQ